MASGLENLVDDVPQYELLDKGARERKG